MKARIENGRVKRYVNLPKYYKHWAGNFDEQSAEIHEQEGFFEIVFPDFDTDLQTLGALLFNEDLGVFTYPVIDIDIDLEEEKQVKKGELKRAIEDKLILALGVGVLEKLALGIPIPQDTKDLINNLRAQEEATITLIEAFTDPKKLKKFKIKPEDIENSENALKATRKG